MPTDAVRIQIESWDEHQHYSKRNPPWIKLHSKLLDNAEWGVLSGDAAKLLVVLWLMAAREGTEGVIETTVSKLEWRTHHDSATLATLLNSLRDNDFLTYASAMLAPCTQESSASSIEGRDTENRDTETDDESSEAGASDPAEPVVDLLDLNPEDDTDWAEIRKPHFATIRKLLWNDDGPPPNTPKPKRGRWNEANELSVIRNWLCGGLIYADEVEPLIRQLRTQFKWFGPASLSWVNGADNMPQVREAVNEMRKRTSTKPNLAELIGGRRAS